MARDGLVRLPSGRCLPSACANAAHRQTASNATSKVKSNIKVKVKVKINTKTESQGQGQKQRSRSKARRRLAPTWPTMTSPGAQTPPAVPRAVRHYLGLVLLGCIRPAQSDPKNLREQLMVHIDSHVGVCRMHHRLKQRRGWKLTQTAPGIFTWTTPTGRTYSTTPDVHH